MAQTRRALVRTGTLISNGGGHADGKLGRTLRTMLASMVVRQQAAPSVKTQNAADLVALKELVEAGSITPVIDGTYALNETAQAIRRVATGHARGTVVITVNQQRKPVTEPPDSVPPPARPPRLIDAVVAPLAASPPA
jgi:NADPH:quinone reductase-like Zn-dependent oxidoreductase